MDKAAAIARIIENHTDIPPGQGYVVELLRPQDAPGVCQLIHSVYADKYPVEDYYHPERVLEMIASGRLVLVVARLDSGHIAGQGAIFRSSPPNPRLFESGQMVIAPGYRNSFMALKIADTIESVTRSMDQADAFFGEAVCNHLVTQKLMVKYGYSLCGVEVGLMPDGAYSAEGAGSQRVSCAMYARVDKDKPCQAFIPECYHQETACLLTGTKLKRNLNFITPPTPSRPLSSLETARFDFASVVRCQVFSTGQDFYTRMAELDGQAKSGGLAVAQVFVNAGEPEAVHAANTLREMGFFFGGYLPAWFGPDGLMLQKLYVAPDYAAIKLLEKKAILLMEMIRTDHERAQSL